MKLIKGQGNNARLIIVSLCDYSGNWPKPYADAGYTVMLFDLKHGDDVTDTARAIDMVEQECGEFDVVEGVLAAPPCTDFTISGAQYWPRKDQDGTTQKALEVLDACVKIASYFRVTHCAWWALENPVGRIPKLRPELGKPRLYFQPYQFAHLADDVDGERYTKRTGLWGNFNGNTLMQYARENGGPIRVCKQGSWIQKLGGKSERTKELRSMTPKGFAKAFALSHGLR